MKTRSRTVWMTAGMMALLLIGVAAAPVLAHHSFAMYDMTVEKTMTGKLKRFIVGANHSQFVMEVLNPDGSAQLDKEGKPVIWTIETTAASQLQRQNITVDTFKVGTVFTISFSPLRDGRMGGAQRGAGLIMCGNKIPDGGCNEKTGKKY